MDADVYLFEAMRLEALYFTDMTLEDYPALTAILDERGDYGHTPHIEYVRFAPIELAPPDWVDDDTLGAYYNETKTIFFRDGMSVSSLCHEMTHYYEHFFMEEAKEKPGILQWLTVQLWQKVNAVVDGLDVAAQDFLELTYHKEEIEADGGGHDLLFWLKCLDIDIALGLPLETTFGYGREETTKLSLKHD